MGKVNKCILFLMLVFQSSFCFSQNAINLIVLPDLRYSTHHVGVETSVTQNSRMGILVAHKQDSDRPTYGDSNEDVTNTFSRILIPWTYCKSGAWEDSYFITGLFGLEKDKFRSVAGSRAEATFVDFGLLAGYQWFWPNGFNISAMAGGAFLISSDSARNISDSETTDVINYLDKNTKTNQHLSAGVIIGWAF
jgi:hypothetical protein